MTCGIYKITLRDGRCYVGQSVKIENRFRGHKRELRNGTHHARHLQNAWNKYGEDVFTFEVIEECEPEELTEREQFWIDDLDSTFNTSPSAGSSRGVIRSQEYREKISALHKGRIYPPEVRVRMGGGMRGKHLSDEHRAKLSEVGKGRKQTPEWIAKRTAPLKGRPSTSRGVSRSAETRLKISVSLTGHPVPESTRKAVAEANSKRIISEETRAKMSESSRQRWASEKASS